MHAATCESESFHCQQSKPTNFDWDNMSDHDARHLIVWLWCNQCRERVRLEFPPDADEWEIDKVSASFICSGCQKARKAWQEGTITPMAPPATRRDGGPGMPMQLQGALSAAIKNVFGAHSRRFP